MSQSLLQMATDLVLAQIRVYNINPEQMINSILTVHQALWQLRNQEQGTRPTAAAEPALIDWKTSINKRHITCLECGQSLQQISGPHLNRHGMTATQYREKYGIPQNQALSIAAVTQTRRTSRTHQQRARSGAEAPLRGKKKA